MSQYSYKSALIFLNGTYPKKEIIKPHLTEGRIVLACDGAANTLLRYSITPDLIVGDFDSITDETLEFYNKKDVKTFRREGQNESDFEFLISYLLKENIKEALVFGGGGGRFDHELINYLLPFSKDAQSIQFTFKNEDEEVIALSKNSQTTLSAEPGDLLSLIPIDQQVPIKELSGTQWPLRNVTIKKGSTLGLSNLFLDTHVSLSIGDADLLACITKKKLTTD